MAVIRSAKRLGRGKGSLKLAAFNVNNVIKRLPNVLRWLAETGPDIVCLQELNAKTAAFLTRRSVTLDMHPFGQASGPGMVLRSFQRAVNRS